MEDEADTDEHSGGAESGHRSSDDQDAEHGLSQAEEVGQGLGPGRGGVDRRHQSGGTVGDEESAGEDGDGHERAVGPGDQGNAKQAGHRGSGELQASPSALGAQL